MYRVSIEKTGLCGSQKLCRVFHLFIRKWEIALRTVMTLCNAGKQQCKVMRTEFAKIQQYSQCTCSVTLRRVCEAVVVVVVEKR